MYKGDSALEDVMANIIMENSDGHVDGYKEVAKEAKDIAIEFANFIRNHRLDFQPGRDNGYIGLDLKTYSVENLFNKFIEKYEAK